MRRTLTSVAVALAGAALVTAGGWSLQAAALPPPERADRVAADASAWLHYYRLVVDVFHVRHHRLKGACLRGWFPDAEGVKTQASLLSLGSRPTVRVAGRRGVSREAGYRARRLPVRLLALVGCSGKLAQILAAAAQSGRSLHVERSYAANQPAVALTVAGTHDERLTLYVSPTTFRPLVAIAEREGRAATARLYLNRIEPRTLQRFRFPPESRTRSRR